MMKSSPTQQARDTSLSARGFSLIELMVAVAVGMILILVITTIITRHEASRRTLTAGNEATLNATFASYTLEQEIRNAGSGFSHNNGSAFGCALRASRGNSRILPRQSAFPAPFASLPDDPFLAPIIVYPGTPATNPDIIVVNAGTGGMGEVSYRMNPLARTTASLSFETTLGLKGNDLILLHDNALGCMIQQVESTFVAVPVATAPPLQILPLAGTYYAATIGPRAITDYLAGRIHLLGNSVGNMPRFQAFGIDANNRFFRFDLLNADGSDSSQLMAEGILDLRARYGLDTDGNGIVDTWAAPSDTDYTPAALRANPQRIQRIAAVRIGMVIAGDLVEKENVSLSDFVLFGSLGNADLRHTVTLTSEQQRRRIRTVEFTVPIRNVLQINQK